MKKHLSILGSTGSIGTQTIDILSSIDAEVVALTTNRNVRLIEEQARTLHPKLCAAFDEQAAKALKTALADTDIEVLSGMDGLIAAATHPDCDTVVTAVVGMVGLLPTLAAIDARKDIALANKETLVCAGGLVMEAARRRGVHILPVDSEHSAIFQCVQAAQGKSIDILVRGGIHYPGLKHAVDSLAVGVVIPFAVFLEPLARSVQQQRLAVGCGDYDCIFVSNLLVFRNLVESRRSLVHCRGQHIRLEPEQKFADLVIGLGTDVPDFLLKILLRPAQQSPVLVIDEDTPVFHRRGL